LGLFIHIPWACSFTFVGPVFLNPDRVPAISLAASLLHYKSGWRRSARDGLSRV